MSVDWSAVIGEVFAGVLVAVLTALVSLFLVKRYFSRLNFSEKMQSYGFMSTGTERQTQKEVRKMCREASLIKIINVSGFHYLNSNEFELKQALARGVEIRFLCAHPDSVFLDDIEKMENVTYDPSGRPMRKVGDRISSEIRDLIGKYDETGIDIRFYSTEYRLPFVITYGADDSATAWLTMTLPPYKSTKAFVLRGRRGPIICRTRE